MKLLFVSGNEKNRRNVLVTLLFAKTNLNSHLNITRNEEGNAKEFFIIIYGIVKTKREILFTYAERSCGFALTFQ